MTISHTRRSGNGMVYIVFTTFLLVAQTLVIQQSHGKQSFFHSRAFSTSDIKFLTNIRNVSVSCASTDSKSVCCVKYEVVRAWSVGSACMTMWQTVWMLVSNVQPQLMFVCALLKPCGIAGWVILVHFDGARPSWLLLGAIWLLDTRPFNWPVLRWRHSTDGSRCVSPLSSSVAAGSRQPSLLSLLSSSASCG